MQHSLNGQNQVIFKPKTDYTSCSGSTWAMLTNRTLFFSWCVNWLLLNEAVTNFKWHIIEQMCFINVHWHFTLLFTENCKVIWPVLICNNEEWCPNRSFKNHVEFLTTNGAVRMWPPYRIQPYVLFTLGTLRKMANFVTITFVRAWWVKNVPS